MLIIDRMVAMVRAGPGPSPEERAAAAAQYQAEEKARQVRQAEERKAFLTAAPPVCPPRRLRVALGTDARTPEQRR